MSKVRIYNKVLCPHLWKDMKLDPKVRVNLLQIAKDFYEKTEFKAPIKNIYFMGSAANYNWTPESDVDVHVLIDFKQLQMPEDTTEKAVKTAASVWNEEHDIRIKGRKVEINLQNITDTKPHVTGIYSLVKNDWVRMPHMEPLSVDRISIVGKYTQLKDYIEKAIQSGERGYMKSVKEYIDAYRQYGLDTKGELSIENLVFKILRSRGILKNLKEAITKTYDKQMSVDEVLNNQLPSVGVNYIIVGLTDANGQTVSGVTTTGNEGHANIQRPSRKMVKPVFWRYKRINSKLYTAPIWSLSHEEANDRLPAIINYLQKTYNVNPKNVTNDEDEYIMHGHRANDVDEGYGAGIPETDRLHIKGHRWQIQSKDAPKTPKMKKEGFDPTSAGPNPEATEGQPPDPDFYNNQNQKMRQMERISLKELLS